MAETFCAPESFSWSRAVTHTYFTQRLWVFIVFTNLIIGISYTSLPRLSSEAGGIYSRLKNEFSLSGPRLTELPYSIPGTSPASLSVEGKKDIKAPAEQLFHKGRFLMMIPKAWGISYIIFPPHAGERLALAALS